MSFLFKQQNQWTVQVIIHKEKNAYIECVSAWNSTNKAEVSDESVFLFEKYCEY